MKETNKKDLIHTHGLARQGMAWHGVARQGKEYFNERPMNTSQAARKKTNAATDRERVFRCIEYRRDATCDEAEKFLNMPHQTCSARFRELEKAGRIVKTERTRPTRTGCQARVYIVTPKPAKQKELFG